MSRRRLAIYGVSDETLALVPALLRNPEVELVHVFHPRPPALMARLEARNPAWARTLAPLLTSDPAVFTRGGLDAVVDAGAGAPFVTRFPEAVRRGLRVVGPLTARLLFGLAGRGLEHRAELLRTLRGLVRAFDFTVDRDELLARLLEIAIAAVGAARGSILLLDAGRCELSMVAAVGIDPALWPLIRPRLGEGIAGRVAQTGRPLHLRGRADPARLPLLLERYDVAAALVLPLARAGEVIGVLCLHHPAREDAFSAEDVEFARRLAALDAELIARAVEHARLRELAERGSSLREVQRVLGEPAGLPARLAGLCRLLARNLGAGIASVYLADEESGELRLAATSLADGSFAAEVRMRPGEGVDGRAAASREPVLLRGPGGRIAYAALPLLAAGRLLGVLSLQAGAGAGRSDGIEAGLAEIARLTAAEVHRSRVEARNLERATKLAALQEAGVRMLSAADLDALARLATSVASVLLEAEHAVLRLRDPETGSLRIRAHAGALDPGEERALFRLDQALARRVLRAREPILVRRVGADPELRQLGAGVATALAAPLRAGDEVLGALAVYDRIDPERFAAVPFRAGDVELFGRLVSALAAAVGRLLPDRGRGRPTGDPETGLAEAAALGPRLEEEILRASGRRAGPAVVLCRIANLARLGGADPGRRRQLLRRLGEAVAAQVRDSDLVARWGEDGVAVLMPEPGHEPAERIAALARGVAEEMTAETPEIELVFGYAVHPKDGTDAEALLAAASSPRIRMV